MLLFRTILIVSVFLIHVVTCLENARLSNGRNDYIVAEKETERIPPMVELLDEQLQARKNDTTTTTLLSFDGNKNNTTIQDWQSCTIFSAPSSNFGWGVFAARPIASGEIFYLAPMFVPIPADSDLALHTILNDYSFYMERTSTGRSNETTLNDDRQETIISTTRRYHNTILGMGMLFNHHSTKPNIRMGVSQMTPQVAGFVALRDIEIGEQLFLSYGWDDGGQSWFASRGLTLDMDPPTSLLKDGADMAKFQAYKSKYCSKVHSGIGHESIPMIPDDPASWLDPSHLPPMDAGLGNAMAKVHVKKGDVIDRTIALPLPRHLVEESILSPLLIDYQDLDESSQAILQEMHTHEWMVPYKSRQTNWTVADAGLDQLSLYPAGGYVGMVLRVDNDKNSNCRLQVSRSNLDGGTTTSLGIELELVATEDIWMGQVLKVNLKRPVSSAGYDMLRAELLQEQGGQPVSSALFS